MKRDERLRQLAEEIYHLKQDKNEIDSRVEVLRDELFRLAHYDFKGKDHLLPVRTVEVPDDFFIRTGLGREEFAQTRYPGWIVEHIEKNISLHKTTFVFKKDPAFVSRVVEVVAEDGVIQVTKGISEFTPEIDWETLKLDRPDLYDRIVVLTEMEEIDEQELGDLIEEHPEELAVIQRHMKVKPPITRLTAKKVKDDGQG